MIVKCGKTHPCSGSLMMANSDHREKCVYAYFIHSYINKMPYLRLCNIHERYKVVFFVIFAPTDNIEARYALSLPNQGGRLLISIDIHFFSKSPK